VIRKLTAVVDRQIGAFELGVLPEVFGLDRTDDGLPGFDFAVCAARPGPVPTTSGFVVQVEYGLDRVADADLVADPSYRRAFRAGVAGA
jgi:hypothetical protein